MTCNGYVRCNGNMTFTEKYLNFVLTVPNCTWPFTLEFAYFHLIDTSCFTHQRSKVLSIFFEFVCTLLSLCVVLLEKNHSVFPSISCRYAVVHVSAFSHFSHLCKQTLKHTCSYKLQLANSKWNREGPPGSCVFQRALLLGRASLLS